MGTGKGKNRRASSSQPKPRAQTKTPSAEGFSFDETKWEEFVQSAGLDDMKIGPYYHELLSPKKEAHKRLNYYKHLMEEILEDTVSVGAIKLPDGYTTEDFEFSTKPHDQTSANIVIHLKGQPPSQGYPVCNSSLLLGEKESSNLSNLQLVRVLAASIWCVIQKDTR